MPFPTVDPSEFSKLDRLIVISTTAIGDTLLSTPTFSALREEYPSALIKALIRDGVCSLFVNNPDIDGVIPYRKGYKGFFQTFREVKRDNFQIALVLHISDPNPLALAAFAGIPYIIGKPPDSKISYLFSKTIADEPGIHAINQRMAVAKHLRPKRSDWPYRLILPLDKERMNEIWQKLSKKLLIDQQENIIIGFQPGASKKFKMWLKENFIALGKVLLALNKHIKILILGSSNEKAIGKDIETGIGKKNRVFSLCGVIPLHELPYIVSGLRCLITNDTGTLHIAIAVRTPTISLFVPTDPLGIGPLQDLGIHRVLSKPRPCGDKCVTKKCSTIPSCMSLISVNEVLEATDKVLRL